MPLTKKQLKYRKLIHQLTANKITYIRDTTYPYSCSVCPGVCFMSNKHYLNQHCRNPEHLDCLKKAIVKEEEQKRRDEYNDMLRSCCWAKDQAYYDLINLKTNEII